MRSLVLFLLATLAFAQSDSVFRATTQLVQIDVVAQDKNGQPVAGLTKDDFELVVNKKPQTIDTFTETSDTPAAALPPLPRGTFSNKQTALEVTQGRYTVFLLDWRNTNWTLQSWSNQELLKMLSAAPPGNKVALYLINNGFQIIQEFTTDREVLKAKAASLWGEVPPPFQTLAWRELAASDSVSAFDAIAKHLEGISGQKVLVWISTGFQAVDVDKAVHALGNANIVVESTEASYLSATLNRAFGPTRIYPGTLRQIAERTGGQFFGPTNDLASRLSEVAKDRAVSYELGYYVSGDLEPGLHPFDIRCKRPGITLLYREGYFVDKKAPPPEDTRTAEQDVLERAVDAVAIPLTAMAVHTMGNKPNIVLRLNIDAHALTLRQDGDVWRGKVTALARFAVDEDDQVGNVPLDSPALTLTQAKHDRALRDGITLRFTMKMPAEATTLRVLVRDEDSGRVGSVTVPVGDLPEM